MKILHVVPSFGLGGMEKIMCAFINNTLECYDHKILALDQQKAGSEWIKDSKIQLDNIDKLTNRRKYFRKLYRYLQKIRPDLLMTYNWGATDAIWLGRIAGIRRIVHVEHGFNVDEGMRTNWKRDIVRFLLYRLASVVIVVSKELETLLQRRYFLRRCHVTRIPNGIDSIRYSPDSCVRERMRQELGFEDNNVVVGFSGRLDPIKNLDLLFRIFVRGVREYPNLRLVIVGDGPERIRLETSCKQESLGGHIVFTGSQQEVVPYLRAMDVFLLTSLSEQMPMTVLEAMSVGIPVVATRVGEIPYIIDHGINGFALELHAPVEAFVESLRALFHAERRETMGNNARQKVVDHFQEHAMVQRYRTVIQTLS